jgi:myo-inositol-1(or 4)-monophosphatase
LLVTEAGGKVTDADGGDTILSSGSILAGNLDIHPVMLSRLTAAK